MIWWPTEVPTLSQGLITLRAPQESDIPALFEGAQDPLIPIFTRIPSNYSMANAEFYVRERSPNAFANQTELQLALEYGNGVDAQFAGAFSHRYRYWPATPNPIQNNVRDLHRAN